MQKPLCPESQAESHSVRGWERGRALKKYLYGLKLWGYHVKEVIVPCVFSAHAYFGPAPDCGMKTLKLMGHPLRF